MSRSALVRVCFGVSFLRRMGRKMASSSADTATNSPNCHTKPNPHIAAIMPASAPPMNQMLTSWIVAASNADEGHDRNDPADDKGSHFSAPPYKF